jgi:hypothetical protein
MRPNGVIPEPEFLRTLTGVERPVIQTPVNLFGIQRLMKALQLAKLYRYAMLGTDMAIKILDVLTEPAGMKLGPSSVTKKGLFYNGPQSFSASERAMSKTSPISNAQ